MKYFLIILLLICTNVQSQFHLRVEPFDKDIESQYCISFTNDNWKTSQFIMKTFDISDESNSPNVVFQQRIFMVGDNPCEDAIAFAKQFNTYQKAIDYNKEVQIEFNRLKIYRNLHPIRHKDFISIKPSCGTTQIY